MTKFFFRSCALTLLATVLVTTTAHAAIKDFSGGNGIGGTLLDLSEQGSETLLEGDEIRDLIETQLHSRLQDFPQLWEVVKDLTVFDHRKLWYLDDRHFAKECLNQSTVETGAQIWACQNDVEVRISRNFWQKADAATRASLVIHEIFTAMRFHDGNFALVHPAIVSLFDTTLNPLNVQGSWLTLGFPYFPTKDQDAVISTQYALEMAKWCLPSGESAFDFRTDVFLSLDGDAHFTSWDTDLLLESLKIAQDGGYRERNDCQHAYDFADGIVNQAWVNLNGVIFEGPDHQPNGIMPQPKLPDIYTQK